MLLNERDAKAAVQAVNYHDLLVSALRDMVEVDDCYSPKMHIAALDNVRSLLDKLDAKTDLNS